LGPLLAIRPIQLFLSRAARLFHAPDSWADIAARIRGSMLFCRPASTKTLPNPCGTFASSRSGSIARNVRTFSSVAWPEICNPRANANMAKVFMCPPSPHSRTLASFFFWRSWNADSERDEKRPVDERSRDLVVIELESLYSDDCILTEKPIDNAVVVATISEGDLDFSDDRRIRIIHRHRFGRRHLLIRTGAQRNSDADQKQPPGDFYDIFLVHTY